MRRLHYWYECRITSSWANGSVAYTKLLGTILKERLNYLNTTITKANGQLGKISGLKMAKHFCFRHCSSVLETGKKGQEGMYALGGKNGKDFFEKPKWLYWGSTPLSSCFTDSSFPSPPFVTVSIPWLKEAMVNSTAETGPSDSKNIPERYHVVYALLLSWDKWFMPFLSTCMSSSEPSSYGLTVIKHLAALFVAARDRPCNF